MDFFVNGRPAGSASQAPFEIEWVALDEGPHTVTATATDNDGAPGTSNVVSVEATAEIVFTSPEWYATR